MLEKIIHNTASGDFILDNSTATSSLTRKVDPYYTRFQRELIAPAINSPELQKKIAGYVGAIAASTVYCMLEIASRTLELTVRGSLGVGAKILDHLQHSQHKSKIKLAGALCAALLGAYIAFPKNDFSPTIPNTNAYVLTVNSNNTGVLFRLGWLGRRQQDYTIFSQNWRQEAEVELARREYGILVLTGHHGAGANYLYGDRGEQLQFDSLPPSDNIQAVIFSACRTAADSEEVAAQVYAPLKERFPHLKLVVGFTGTSLVDDGVIPQVLIGRELLRGENGIYDFADYAIGVNPERVGVAIWKGDGSWEFRNVSRRSAISYRR